MFSEHYFFAEVAELADAPGLGPCGATRGSSNLPFGTLVGEELELQENSGDGAIDDD